MRKNRKKIVFSFSLLLLYQGGQQTWNFWKPGKVREFVALEKSHGKVGEFHEIQKSQGILMKKWEKSGNFTCAK